MAEMRAKIAADRKSLMEAEDLVEEERNQVAAELQQQEDELKRAQYVS